MLDLYQRLARHLDSLPAGFPPTESGVELRILKRLFTAEEAEIAVGLTLLPAPPLAIAKRLGRDVAELAATLEEMSLKGLIYRSTKDGEKRYGAAQFVVGIWEYHVNDLDEGLIRDMHEYMPQLMQHSWVKHETKQLRVVPVAKSVTAEMEVMPYEAAEEIVKQQSRIAVAPCICRKEHQMIGEGCGKLLEACLVFGSGARFYEENKMGRPIDQKEALNILQQAQEAGLVLQPGNAQRPVNICLCCGCCCQILKNLKTLDQPAKAVATNWVARADSENCTACELCLDRCQMDAITVGDAAEVDPDRCIGCGLCVTACDFDALRLIQKEGARRYVPPKNVVQTYIKLARERGVSLS